MANKPKPIWKLEVGDTAPHFTLPATGDAAGRGGPRIRYIDIHDIAQQPPTDRIMEALDRLA